MAGGRQGWPVVLQHPDSRVDTSAVCSFHECSFREVTLLVSLLVGGRQGSQ